MLFGKPRLWLFATGKYHHSQSAVPDEITLRQICSRIEGGRTNELEPCCISSKTYLFSCIFRSILYHLLHFHHLSSPIRRLPLSLYCETYLIRKDNSASDWVNLVQSLCGGCLTDCLQLHLLHSHLLRLFYWWHRLRHNMQNSFYLLTHARRSKSQSRIRFSFHQFHRLYLHDTQFQSYCRNHVYSVCTKSHLLDLFRHYHRQIWRVERRRRLHTGRRRVKLLYLRSITLLNRFLIIRVRAARPKNS